MPHRDLKVDYQAVFDPKLGSFAISVALVESFQNKLKEIQHGFRVLSEIGQLPFEQLPHKEEEASEILEKTHRLRQSFDHLVVLGIGGSALAAKVFDAIGDPRISMQILDTLDPDFLSRIFDALDWSKTLFCVISKAGETLETLAQFFWIEGKLRAKLGPTWKKHVLVITDPDSGWLRSFASEQELFSWPIPKGVGGRFSILSPVGLFPAAWKGLDLYQVLAGARRMQQRADLENFWENPAFVVALLNYLFSSRGKNILVLMGYAEVFRPLLEWYAQLWAESVGKRFTIGQKQVRAGSTPVVVMGPRDQHSQLQLYLDGPQDKAVLFFLLENFNKSLSIEQVPAGAEFLAYLRKKDFGEILKAQAEATRQALLQVGCPTTALVFPSFDAYGLGQALMLFERSTVYAASLYDVNAFDQPGVQSLKKITAEILNG